ncbi:MAG: cytidylate kinase-like family protein [Chloroflexi bacterium]|nr:cytidylate kinase-like family protein [Chloroflexota bacterium]
MPVVTIAGEFGAGGREIGEMVAQQLGAHYVDREIVAQAAKRLGASPQELARKDDHLSSRGERLGRALEEVLRKSALGGSGDPYLGTSGLEMLLSRSYQEAMAPDASEVDDARYLSAVQSVIREVAQEGNVVIIRRGGQFVLKNLPNALHIFVYGPMEGRVKRVMGREKLRRAAAEKLIHDTERDWVAYFKKFYKADVRDPSYYDLMVNTDKQPLATAARLIAHAARILAVRRRIA